MRLLECAKIVSTHGIKGEVKIKIETDNLTRFDKDSVLYIGDNPNKVEKITIDNFRIFKNMGLLSFNKITNINDCLTYVGKTIYVDTEMYEDDGLYYDDIIGLTVFDRNIKVGVVKDILEVPQGEILIIEKINGKTSYVPLVEEFVKNIDIREKRIDIESIEGLL